MVSRLQNVAGMIHPSNERQLPVTPLDAETTMYVPRATSSTSTGASRSLFAFLLAAATVLVIFSARSSAAAELDDVQADQGHPLTLSGFAWTLGAGLNLQLKATHWLAFDVSASTALVVNSGFAGLRLYAADGALAPYVFGRAGVVSIHVAGEGIDADELAMVGGVGLSFVGRSRWGGWAELGALDFVHDLDNARSEGARSLWPWAAAGVSYRF